jgi:hypothetical protein
MNGELQNSLQNLSPELQQALRGLTPAGKRNKTDKRPYLIIPHGTPKMKEFSSYRVVDAAFVESKGFWSNRKKHYIDPESEDKVLIPVYVLTESLLEKYDRFNVALLPGIAKTTRKRAQKKQDDEQTISDVKEDNG